MIVQHLHTLAIDAATLKCLASGLWLWAAVKIAGAILTRTRKAP